MNLKKAFTFSSQLALPIYLLSIAFSVLGIRVPPAEAYTLKPGNTLSREIIYPESQKVNLETSQSVTDVFRLAKKGGSQRTLNVLFIGNSFIFMNSLPEVFSDLAKSGGHLVTVKMSANPGWKLKEHAQSEATLSTIAQEDWDYVILQEQSVLPVFKADRRQLMHPAVKVLKKKAKESGAKTILLMTWARKNGIKKLGWGFNEMQEHLTQGYMEVANESGAFVAPVGTAWKNTLKRKPYFPLWQNDDSHPSKSGTYLAACVLFGVIFNESPEKINYTSSLTNSTAIFLQETAWETILETQSGIK